MRGRRLDRPGGKGKAEGVRRGDGRAARDGGRAECGGGPYQSIINYVMGYREGQVGGGGRRWGGWGAIFHHSGRSANFPDYLIEEMQHY